jgi:hypothetical protein
MACDIALIPHKLDPEKFYLSQTPQSNIYIYIYDSLGWKFVQHQTDDLKETNLTSKQYYYFLQLSLFFSNSMPRSFSKQRK